MDKFSLLFLIKDKLIGIKLEYHICNASKNQIKILVIANKFSLQEGNKLLKEIL